MADYLKREKKQDFNQKHPIYTGSSVADRLANYPFFHTSLCQVLQDFDGTLILTGALSG